MKPWIPNALVLSGDTVKLVPLEKNHKAGLLQAASDGNLWELWFTSVPDKNTIDAYLEKALSQKEKGIEFPFTVIDVNTNTIIGCTRFYNMQPENRRLEIGYTWYAKSHQRTGVNSNCKLLLLQYAFEELDCIAVQLITNWFNIKSREAIARLGAKQDGVLRNHSINKDGSYRDTVVFSITETEWSGVKKNLQLKLNAYKP